MTAPVMNGFALCLRTTPTRGWRGATQRTEAGIRGTRTDMPRWLHEEAPMAASPKVSINKLPQVFSPILSAEELDTVVATRHCYPVTEIGVRNREMIAFTLDRGTSRQSSNSYEVTSKGKGWAIVELKISSDEGFLGSVASELAE